MRYFKLKTLSVSAPNNRVLRIEHDKVYMETTWEPGKADKLVEKGDIYETDLNGKAISGAAGKKATPAAAPPPPPVAKATPPAPETPGQEEKEAGDFDPATIEAAMRSEQEAPEANEPKLPDYDEVTKKEIQAALDEMAVAWDKKDSKKKLYAAWQAANGVGG